MSRPCSATQAWWEPEEFALYGACSIVEAISMQTTPKTTQTRVRIQTGKAWSIMELPSFSFRTLSPFLGQFANAFVVPGRQVLFRPSTTHLSNSWVCPFYIFTVHSLWYWAFEWICAIVCFPVFLPRYWDDYSCRLVAALSPWFSFCFALGYSCLPGSLDCPLGLLSLSPMICPKLFSFMILGLF